MNYLQQINFFNNELLEGLEIDNSTPEFIMVTLDNDNVQIYLTIETNEGNIWLKLIEAQIKKKGVSRCALFFLLNHLIEKGLIDKTYTIFVDEPVFTREKPMSTYNRLSADIRQIRRLMEYGFEFMPYVNKPNYRLRKLTHELKASVEVILNKLRLQCQSSKNIANHKRKKNNLETRIAIKMSVHAAKSLKKNHNRLYNTRYGYSTKRKNTPGISIGG